MAGEAFSAFVRFFVKDDVSDEARRVKRSAEEAAEGMDRAADSAGGRFSNGLAKAKSAAEAAVKRMAALGESATALVAKGFEKAKSAAGTAVKGMAAFGTGATALIGGMFALSAASQEYTEDMGKLTTAFGTARDAQGDLKWSTEDAKSTYNDFVGILGETDQAVEASNHLAELCNNQEELSNWGTIAAGVYAKFGDSLPLEGLTEAANETAKVGQVTGPLADALNWAGESEDEFNAKLAECSSEQERAALITETLSGLYGEAGKQYQETNADLIAARQAQSDWNGAMAQAGQAVTPITTALMEMGSELLGKAMPYLQQFADYVAQNMPAVQQWLSDTAGKMAEAWQNAQPIVQPLIEAIKTVFQWFIDNLPLIAPIVAAVAGGFLLFQGVATIIQGITTALGAFKAITDLVKLAQMALNLVMMANPFVLVALAITALIAVFVYLWNTNEEFRNAVIAIWEAIKTAAETVFGGIRDFLQLAWDTIKQVATTVWETIKGVITGVAEGIYNGVKTHIEFLFAYISLIFNAIRGVASSIWNGIKDTITNVVNGIRDTVSNVVNGIRDTVSNAFNSARDTASSVWNGIKDTISNAINGARDAVQWAIDAIKGFFNFSISWPHIPVPRFAISPPGWSIGDLLKGSIPSLSIDWYAKGAVFDKPTVFATPNGYKGFGEAGPEAAAPVSVLKGYIRDAVAEAMGNTGGGYVANINVTTGETSEDKLARMIARENKRLAYDLGVL